MTRSAREWWRCWCTVLHDCTIPPCLVAEMANAPWRAGGDQQPDALPRSRRSRRVPEPVDPLLRCACLPEQFIASCLTIGTIGLLFARSNRLPAQGAGACFEKANAVEERLAAG
jgi:hypothetical protein